MNPTHVVFDIGGVLVDWRPHMAWSARMGSEAAAKDFMERIDFYSLNKRADGGETFAALSTEIEDPEDSAQLADYPALYARTVARPIDGTWALLDRMAANGTPIHAITNWSAETWPEGLRIHPRLGTVFKTLVISGREQISKPDAGIFTMLCVRAGIHPDEAVFIDDTAENVEGARAIGMDGIHFTTPEALERALQDRGLL